MRYFILFIALLLASVGFSNAQWKRLLAEPTFTVVANPKNPNTMYVGGIDRKIYRTYNAGATWDTLVIKFFTRTPITTNILIHPIDTNIIVIGGIGMGTILRSTDGGNNWDDVLKLPNQTMTFSSESIIGDPDNPDIMYAGELKTNTVYKSENKGATWDLISYIDCFGICTIVRVPNSTVMVAGCIGGQIQKSDNNGVSWRKIKPFFTPYTAEVELPRIVFSKRNPLVGYAVATYFTYAPPPTGGLHQTLDGGETWKSIGFVDTSLWGLAVRQFGIEDEIFVGGFTADHGHKSRVIPGQGIIRRSQDGGARWKNIDYSIDWIDTIYRNVWMMRFVGDNSKTERLFMATEAGFFVMDEPSTVKEWMNQPPTTEWNARIQGEKLTIKFPDDFAVGSEITVRLTSLIGERFWEITSSPGAISDFTIPFCSPGVYCCEIISGTSHRQILVYKQ